MSNAAKFKRKAAEFELQKQFDKAVGMYVRAIEAGDAEGGEVDVSVLNKVGDLSLRLGRVSDAVSTYERAVEHYSSLGLFNNAIALCNKILRNAPGRAGVYLTLGRICVRKGMRMDASRNFLEYASRMRQEGRTDEAMRSLAEVAGAMPELDEVRRLVEEHAERVGITLPSAPAGMLPVSPAPARGGLVFLDIEDDEAASPPPTAAAGSSPPAARSVEPPPAPAADSASFDDLTLFDPEGEAPVVSQHSLVAGLPGSAGVSRAGEPSGETVPPDEVALTDEPEGARGGDGADDALADFITLPELTAIPASGTAPPADRERPELGSARGVPRLDPHDFILPGELPPIVLPSALLELRDRAPSPVLAPVAPATDGKGHAHPADAEALPVDRGSVDLEGAADFEPFDALEVALAPLASTATVNVAQERCDRLRDEVAAHPGDWARRRRLGEALLEAGERAAGLAELTAAALGLEVDGGLAEAARVLDELLRIAPDDISYHQKRVELAVRLGERERLRESYLDLADALVRTGQGELAEPVYARVLELDPWDYRARSALGEAAPPPPEPGPPAPADDGYVNLADWLVDDSPRPDTRMRVQEPTVTGDEDADFDELLQHFREGVSRTLGEDDFESHYDLGVAYKEMGLLEDAIAEFQRALRSPTHRLPSYEALGQCFLEQGSFPVAVTVLSRALHEPGVDDEQRVGVLYLLGYACEALQRRDEARGYYQRVYATDILFRDVAARLAALEPGAA
jgi:tetratricopeptide (TPR) repeat protein